MKLLVISAQKGAGKDTLAQHLVSNGWISLSYADTLKDALMVLFNWDKSIFEHNSKELIDPEWNTSPRQMCQLLGTEFLRQQCSFLNTSIKHPTNNETFNATFHIKRTHQKILKILEYVPNPKIVITDGRFKDELDYVKFMGGSIVKIIRPSMEDNHYSNHPSETYVKSLTEKDVDYTIINNGTIEELWSKIDKII
jgi:hypothetical protein